MWHRGHTIEHLPSFLSCFILQEYNTSVDDKGVQVKLSLAGPLYQTRAIGLLL